MIRTLIVDDDPFIRESLKLILSTMEGIEVIGTCGNGMEAFAFTNEDPKVDIVLMDIRMPICDGVEGTRLIMESSKSCKVLILTTFDDDDYIVKALRFGAGGYMLKNIPPEQIAAGIRTVHAGHMLIHPDIAKKLGGLLHPIQTQKSSKGTSKKVLSEYGLSHTEEQIVSRIASGFSNKEIAQQLFLSEGTIKNYITDILGKLTLRDRTQIAIFYLKEIGE
jgi:DNA-binding NarL/FixJ family response regulator